ncbi:hypothetical protein ACFPIJ_14025 [Dactylosporangium cerinum]|uniref:Uncharacterized protein n=1 Tax=Dactylosporangium cerinum TaxID=1434730 RepID=A0ABV9VT19_9ACTN
MIRSVTTPAVPDAHAVQALLAMAEAIEVVSAVPLDAPRPLRR